VQEYGLFAILGPVNGEARSLALGVRLQYRPERIQGARLAWPEVEEPAEIALDLHVERRGGFLDESPDVPREQPPQFLAIALLSETGELAADFTALAIELLLAVAERFDLLLGEGTREPA
jgi:hypothetical protein